MSTTNWMDRMKKAGKSVVDAGAKTMLRVCVGVEIVILYNCFLACILRSGKRQFRFDVKR